MEFNSGDVVRLGNDDRKMIVVSPLDEHLLWVRLVDPDRADMYAFRREDLKLVASLHRDEDTPPATSVPQVPRAPIAA